MRTWMSVSLVASLGLLGAMEPQSAGAVMCKKSSGALFVRSGTCKKKEVAVTAADIGAVGPDGATGTVGPTGATGSTGPMGPAGPGAQWALVAGDGTIVAQTGGISLFSHPFTGEYYLDFPNSLAGKGIFIAPSNRDNAFSGAAQASPCGSGTDAYPNCAGIFPDTRLHAFVGNQANNAGLNFSFYVLVLP